MRYFEKESKKENENLPSAKDIARTGLVLVPFAGGYLASDPKHRKNHPFASTLLGPAGSMGAASKDDKKSRLVKSMLTMMPIGMAINGVSNSIGADNPLVGAGIGLARGAAGGAVGGAAYYGLGKLFGHKEKK